MLNAIIPWMLLALSLALGLGAAMNAPAWQAVISELVGEAELRAAVTLNGVGYNVARCRQAATWPGRTVVTTTRFGRGVPPQRLVLFSA